MKNFTKQNFKTNPLWIRLLIMAFMLLAGTSSVWGDTYLAGSFNSWNASDGNYKFVSGSLSVGMSPGTYEFKIVEDGKWYSMNNTNITATLSTAIKMYENNNNNKITISTAGIYTFTWDATNNKLKVTYPTAKTYTATIKFKRPSSWANTPRIHMFYDGSNTLVDNQTMTKEGVDASGNTWFTYKYNVTTGYTNATIMFNNGGWNNGQTAEQFKGDLGTDYCLASATSTTSIRGNVTTATCPVYCEAPTSVSITRGTPTTGNICQGSTIDLTANVDGSGDITYEWTKTSGGSDWTIANASAQKCTVTAGTGSATFQIKATRCSTSKTSTVTLTADAKSALTLTFAETNICKGDEVELNSFVYSHKGTVTWYNSSSYVDSNKAPEKVSPTSTHKYYATAKNGVCPIKEMQLNVIVKSAPTKPAVTLSPADGNIISGNKATLSISSPVDGATYTLYEETKGEIETGRSFEITEAGTYYVIGTDDCGQESPASDSKTITVCTIGSTLNSAEYDAATQKVSLEGTFELCGKESFHGFQWRKEGSDWCEENVPTDNSAYVMLGKTTEGGTKSGEYTIEDQNSAYVFRTYVVPVGGAWIYGNEITVTPCINIAAPNVTAEAICAGSEATLTLSNRQNGVTYELGNEEIFKTGNTHTVKPEKTTTYTITATSTISCEANQKASTDVEVEVIARPEAPKFAASSTTVCEGETIELPTPTNIGDYEISWSIKDAKNTPVPVTLSKTTTFCAVLSNNGCTSTATEYTVNVTNIPTISGATFAQPGKDNAITLTAANGILADWSVDNGGDLSQTSKSNTTDFSADANGTYTITADNKGCKDTHVVTVSDAFYVYMRQPKKGETAYDNFYYPTQNPTQGGDLFYKEYASIPPAEGYTDYNTGGVAHDIIFTDCDGYVWYGFKASDKLIDGTNYFTVRAPNLGGNGGYYTHTYLTKPGAMTSDIYYTMSEEASGNSRGWYITKVSAPYSGPVIKATDESFNKNNFADFAALYVTDCSGKEIVSYQWYKDGEVYVSECEYSIVEKNKTTKLNEYKTVTGDAGKTNNIRPNAAGNYTCKVTYKGGTTATSAAFEVSATSGTTYADFNSNLPVIMVNTGKKDFPSCPVSGETASKNADKMKKKLSVDVKILHDGEIVYDRKARMAYRGSSSLNFQKKSYAFCPGDANCGDADKGEDYVKTAKLNMLGIGDACDKDWVLYAAAADPSMLRNRMVFETYQAMRPGDWGVHSRYVELIINGEYKGVYVMMDKITQNEKRVNVKWDVDDATKRGFILKFDKTDIPDRSVDYPDGDEKTFLSKYSGKYDITTYDAQVDQAFEIEYPEKEDIQDDGGNWYEVVNFIKGKINDFETALAAGDYATVQQIIDYESWADWFILSEYTKNVDAFRASCVFVYDGNKIKATPLWDQELSFNNQSPHANRYPEDKDNKGCQDATGLLIKHNNVYTDGFAAPFWFTGQLAGGKGTEKLAAKTFTGALLNDQCFVQMVKNRWDAHMSGALSNASLTALITAYEKELTSDVRTREANFWSSNGYSRNTLSCPWGGNSTGYYDDDYATAKGHITNWISDNNATNTGTGRRKGLDAAISALEGTGLDISISPASIETTPWVPVVVQVKNESGYEYTLTYTDGLLDQVKDLIIERSGETYKYHIPRPADWGTGNEAVEGERKDISYGIKATLQIGDANNQCGTSGELPSATATIILQDEDNDDCNNN